MLEAAGVQYPSHLRDDELDAREGTLTSLSFTQEGHTEKAMLK